jgi:ketosteroid isomerase-like protein
MRTTVLIMSGMFVTLTLLAGQTLPAKGEDVAKAKEDLLKAEHAWNEAYKNRDAKVLSRILTDDFILTDDDGKMYNKAQYVESVVRLAQVASYTLEELEGRVWGNVGVVTGIWRGTMTMGGKDASGSFRFTDTFLRRQGRWQVVASQDTRIAK